MDVQHIEFTVESAGQRLDKCVVASVGDRLSRSQIQAMIRDGLVTVDGQQVKPGSGSRRRTHRNHGAHRQESAAVSRRQSR
jgi:23S rRNA-/tRNA-specific pseudouridylate synthase